MRNILLIAGAFLLFIFGVAVFNSQKQEYSNNTEVVATPEVPPPQETDIIRTFFNLIDEGKVSDAVIMMKEGTAYESQFAAIDSIKVLKLEELSKANWTEEKHQYMATLDVVMDPSSASEPIPYFGYEKGENIRFITLIKEEGKWRIEGLATGP